MLERLRELFGAGGPSVATMLENTVTVPGGTVRGTVRIVGGTKPVTISGVSLGLSVPVVVDGAREGDTVVFAKQPASEAFELAPGEHREFDFEYFVPHECPVTEIAGVPLEVAVGLRTRLQVAHAFDSLDSDPLVVRALAAQDAIAKALAELGFRIVRSDVEHGTLRGVSQALPFFQEIEFHPGQKYAVALNQLELTFVAAPTATEVVLELDRRGGLISGRDVFGKFVVEDSDLETTDWAGQLDDWIMEACRRHGLFQQ